MFWSPDRNQPCEAYIFNNNLFVGTREESRKMWCEFGYGWTNAERI